MCERGDRGAVEDPVKSTKETGFIRDVTRKGISGQMRKEDCEEKRDENMSRRRKRILKSSNTRHPSQERLNKSQFSELEGYIIPLLISSK